VMLAFNLSVEAAWTVVVHQDVWEAAGLLAMVALMPMLVVVQGLLAHGALWLLGGVKAPLKATLRANCYATAPLLFSFSILESVAGIWSFVILVVGIRETHQCGLLRAIAAPLLPVCLIVIGAVALVRTFGIALSDLI
jgi:hypothetical protein